MEEAAEISNSWKNTFKRLPGLAEENLFRDEDSRKIVVDYVPPLSQVASAAALARQGFLTSVRSLALVDVDISGVPSEDLAKLLECVTESVYIENLRGDVTSVFSNINSMFLVIDNMSLSPVDTQALVSAMDTRVEEINLHEGVTLDLETLTQYDGTGKCGFLRTWNIKCNNWLEDQEDDFEEYEKVEKWRAEMHKNWGSWGTCRLGSIPNYIEFIRDWSDIFEYEESFEVDENEEEDGLNSDNEVENELKHPNGEEEIDFGDKVVNETTEEKNPHDLA